MDGENTGKYWDKSWNPLKVKGGGYHCTKCSPGCLNCWAEKYNLRFGNKQPYNNRPIEYVLDEKVLQQPLDRKKSTTYFVCDLCDLFHPEVPFGFIDKVFAKTAVCGWHKMLMLTKRIARAKEYYERPATREEISKLVLEYDTGWATINPLVEEGWPIPNIHFGVTICNQAEADEKIPILLQIPAAHRWVSAEPLLGPVNFRQRLDKLYGWVDGVVVGGESGPKRRECKIEWVRDIVQQCKAANVAVYVKQLHIVTGGGISTSTDLKPCEGKAWTNYKLSKNPQEWPEDLRVREFAKP